MSEIPLYLLRKSTLAMIIEDLLSFGKVTDKPNAELENGNRAHGRRYYRNGYRAQGRRYYKNGKEDAHVDPLLDFDAHGGQRQHIRRIKVDSENKGIGGCMNNIQADSKFVHDQDRIPDVPKGQLLRSQSEGLLKSTEVQGQNSQGVKTKVLSKRKLRPCSYCSETHVWGKLNCPCFGKRCSYCAIFNHNQASCWFKQMDD